VRREARVGRFIVVAICAGMAAHISADESRAGGLLHAHRCTPQCQPVPPPVYMCPTVLTAGNEPEDLKVYITGPRFDTIEAYFRHELWRDTLPGAINLHCYCNVVLASKNPFGTFAVRFGANHDTLRVYGWKTSNPQPEWRTLTLEPGYPIAMEWVTTRILKVKYGPQYEKECILRFNDSDQPWTQFNTADNTWTVIPPDPGH